MSIEDFKLTDDEVITIMHILLEQLNIIDMKTIEGRITEAREVERSRMSHLLSKFREEFIARREQSPVKI